MLRNLFLFTCGLFLSANNFAHAQGNGASLLAKVDQYSAYNDIWGYTAPDGREYAIVGTTSGTAFYNCTDPTAPYRVGYISGPNSTWRDMKTYSHYAYIVTEGGGGVQIVNLQNPENPTLVKTWGTNHWTNAHNIAIDVADAKAYVCGTNGGLKVLNLSNPETPTIWATRSSPYIHDLHVQNGLAHFAEIYDGRYRITNVATNFPTRDRITTPGQFTHSTWANANDSVCVTTDEVNGGSLGLYDISDPTNIQHLDTWSPNLNSIVHNAFIVGDLVYASWYTEGLVVADISDPSNVTFHASYDTSSYGSGSGFHGAWGCYPFSPSGVIYVSDIEEGFHIVKVDGPAFDLDHTPVANTTNETGPYVVDAEIRSLKAGASLAQADVWYRTNGSAWASAPMAPTGTTDVYQADIPGTPSPTIVEYYIHATDTLGNKGWLPESSNPGDDYFSFAVGIITEVYANDFEAAGDEGWTHGMIATQDDWQRGTPQGASGNSSRHDGTSWYDPDTAASGTKCWSNDLGASGWNGSYASNTHNWLESPTIDCTGKTNTTLIFQRWLTVEGAPYDNARVLVNGNVVWQNPAGFGGDTFHTLDSSWRQMTYDISQWADNNPQVTVRFELESDSVMELGGWNIDDVRIVSLQGGDPTNTISLTGPSSVPAGWPANFAVSNAPAQERVYFLYSFNSSGFSYQGHQMDLGMPISLGATRTADQSGNAQVTANIPSKLSGRMVFIEAAAIQGTSIRDSNMLPVAIL